MGMQWIYVSAAQGWTFSLGSHSECTEQLQIHKQILLQKEAVGSGGFCCCQGWLNGQPANRVTPNCDHMPLSGSWEGASVKQCPAKW